MSPPPKPRSDWPFARKFPLWLTDHRLTVNSFAKRFAALGFKQRTLNAWTSEGVQIPAAGLAAIAKATGLPAQYWLDDEAPYPPTIDVEGLVQQVLDAMRSMSPAKAREVARLVSDPSEMDRVLAARRAIRGE